jgi:ornithine cyclodeaminase/alanine dehydrogenase-like protein (mu-crystallin family)
MRLLVLSGNDIHAVLGRAECAEAMRAALIALQNGDAQQPLRTVVRPDGAAGFIGLMPSYFAAGQHDGESAYGIKALVITPGNPAAGLDTHQGVILLSSGQTGEPVALLNASAVTEIRTAAVSVVATDLLARPDADVLAMIGAGVQARAHIRALDDVRKLTEIRLVSRDHVRADQLAASLRDVVRAPIRVCASARDAVAGAGIVVTATSSATPVLEADWLEPGTHINAVGACLPSARELDTATVAGGVMFADSRVSLLAESGDYLLAAADGAVTPAHIRAELGEVLTGSAPGREHDEEITIFESLGLAVEDLAAAHRAYLHAERTGLGTRVNF